MFIIPRLIAIFVGSIQSAYYLRSDHYVPDRIKEKFDKVVSSMMENGLSGFYESTGRFITKYRLKRFFKSEDNDVRALTLEELIGSLMFCACLLGIALVFFVIDIIAFNFMLWRQKTNKVLKMEFDLC